MTNNPSTKELLDQIVEWLDRPYRHLNEKNRREHIEDIVDQWVERQNRKARQRERFGTFMFYGSGVTLVISILLNSSKVLELFQ